LEKDDFLILSGPPGVGKTKLACEALIQFNKQFPDYRIFGVTYRHADLIDDMSEYLLSGDDIVLLIDDANRIDRIEQIFSLFTQPRSNKLKIVLTVRDYGLDTITSRFY
jgi:replication-associated recombination protein RarA